MTETILSVDKLTVSFDGFKALNDLTFSMKKGELRFLIGPNGAGKTTLLDVVTGKTRPHSGRVTFDSGVNVLHTAEHTLVQKGIGRKFQTPTAFGSLTVYENLEAAIGFNDTLPRLFTSITRTEVDKIHEVLGRIGLAHRADVLFDYDRWASTVAEAHAQQLGRGPEEDTVSNTMSMAAWRAATDTGAAAILSITRTGFTVRSIARFRPQAPILAFTTDERAARQLSLSWGATTNLLPADTDASNQIDRVLVAARETGLVRSGDLVAVAHGSDYYPGQATDTVRLARIP
jgi:ABC-type sugar transport system ATPase subunit